MFTREIRSDTVKINANAEKVWSILYDIDHYPEWNPFTHKVVSQMEPGSSIDLYVHMPKRGDRIQQETICTMKKPEQMAWQMSLGFPALLKARRDQFICVLNEASCTYETVDVFEGLLAPLVYALFRDDVEGGFNNMAYALKERAESC